MQLIKLQAIHAIHLSIRPRPQIENTPSRQLSIKPRICKNVSRSKSPALLLDRCVRDRGQLIQGARLILLPASHHVFVLDPTRS